MTKFNAYPSPAENPDQAPPELDISSLSAIENWYRCLRPDRDMRTLPLEVHVDAIASATLHLNNAELPTDAGGRIREGLKYSNSPETTARKIALNGADSLILTDLILELSERNEIPPEMQNKLLDTGRYIAQIVRDNPTLPLKDRVNANGKMTNVHIALLKSAHATQPRSDFSSDYIKIVREEAAWMSKHCKDGVPKGDLFETYIGVLSRYKLWDSQSDERFIARHATIREDAPAPKRKGGSGFEVAHDVVIATPSTKELLQCKWGGLAHEFSEKYNEDKVKLITETTDDGTLLTYEAFAKAFSDIARSSSFATAQSVEEMVVRYKIDLLVDNLNAIVPKAAGGLAVR